ncbi:MAG TPA: polysaccharide biosynthesis protein [Longimicrobium sp.]|nr:polysaccharide biosynthesis protein [Longimicrobium sp.]
MPRTLEGADVLILGGTGSLGQRLFRRILSGELGAPGSLTVFSRDEAKQHYMRLAFLQQASATDDIIYRESVQRVRFAIGDVRNYAEVKRSADRADVIFHAAALKQVPTCEYFGAAAVDTNIMGAVNLARALRDGAQREKSVVGISTDKACKPVNLMGMTKAIQERILVQANLDSPWVRFVNVRYGNVMASRGSAIPFFIDRVRSGRPIPITDWRMTRFLMTLDESVDLIFNALRLASPGETWLPRIPSALVTDMARAVAGDEEYPLELTGIRPGEKIHEILLSEEEVAHSERRGENLVILPILPELRRPGAAAEPLPFAGEYSSADDNLTYHEVRELLLRYGLTAETAERDAQEIYR